MCFWFAALLVAWKEMAVGKALFYSFFAVARCAKAFIVYALAWMLMGVILPSILSTIVKLLFGSSLLSLMVLLPLSLILTAILYCSFYPSYVTIFGAPDEADAGPMPMQADPETPAANNTANNAAEPHSEDRNDAN